MKQFISTIQSAFLEFPAAQTNVYAVKSAAEKFVLL
jgi:hypothetical protein